MSWEDDLFAWVDEGAPRQDDSYSVGRSIRLFFATLVYYFVKSLPATLFALLLIGYELSAKRKAEEHAKQQQWQDMEKAAHEGRTGEAFRRLFEVDAPPDLQAPYLLPNPLEE